MRGPAGGVVKAVDEEVRFLNHLPDIFPFLARKGTGSIFLGVRLKKSPPFNP